MNNDLDWMGERSPTTWPGAFYKVSRLFFGLIAYAVTLAAIIFLIIGLFGRT